MRNYQTIYINGTWVEPIEPRQISVVDPASEEVVGSVAGGGAADVDSAAVAARAAFASWSLSTRAERLALLEAVLAEYNRRSDDLAIAVREEMGAPIALAREGQVGSGAWHLATAIEVLKNYTFEEDRGQTKILREPIGVCAMITPWNWPLNQIACKVAPALATGCTMILKPSEVAPFSGQIFAEIVHAAGVPAGVFNMVQGTGSDVGIALSRHPQIDMISFTGSTRAGIEVAKNAATSVKRVAQELGGKSPNILLDDASLADNVAASIHLMMMNSGQSCNAATRMLVPKARMDEVIEVARNTVAQIKVGDPQSDASMGPVVSHVQYENVQRLIAAGIDGGATLVAGGVGRPDGIKKGYFVKPTVFANVTNDMNIAREEIFGPVLSILGYDSIDDAIAIGNDTDYGLSASVRGEDVAQVRDIASKLRAGQVSINGGYDIAAPFGGYKMSGNGREWGEFAFGEYLETKAMVGYY